MAEQQSTLTYDLATDTLYNKEGRVVDPTSLAEEPDKWSPPPGGLHPEGKIATRAETEAFIRESDARARQHPDKQPPRATVSDARVKRLLPAVLSPYYR